ncbi:serine carboxypeptidase [Drechmeria coniospora]|uniref:Serine carboxypeptidase n=1 Tax=Drechmeria coniospora TaxID=98403 RepID=A0A151GH36_DRECN|nr:serine carboxypeptidase [Drechmeria coniospora]KYK56341.1 serine carboxypeptidase [Drechmeria coniospora]ODA76795.1 hypothetical protein RJ55_07310 [Drechmeria coniospora]
MYVLKSIALAVAIAPLLISADNFPGYHSSGPRKTFAVRQAAANPSSRFLNDNSKAFAVNGKEIPEVNFDIGESYAGVLPISDRAGETRKLFFWFFPSAAPEARDEVGVCLGGGPGCSGLKSLLSANGPFLWPPGALAPVKNPYSLNRLTNFVWIDQPVGTGFSQGEPSITNQEELAEQFKGFWKNFVDIFQLHDSKMYFASESYGGTFVPHIANSFLESNDSKYFNVKGVAINNPSIGNNALQIEMPALPFSEYWSNVLGLDEPTLEKGRQRAEELGFTSYMKKYFTFPPPKEEWPQPPSPNKSTRDILVGAMYAANPCFDDYNIIHQCPTPYNQLVGAGADKASGGPAYFQREDVKKAINAPPDANWTGCAPKVFVGRDRSSYPTLDGTLANVVHKTKNVIVGSGDLDLVLPTNGTLFALQNMTWGGDKGFQRFPSTPFFVPQHGADTGAYGNLGSWSQERGLPFYSIRLAGHKLSGGSAGAIYRVIQVMLGRVKDFSSHYPLF